MASLSKRPPRSAAPRSAPSWSSLVLSCALCLRWCRSCPVRLRSQWSGSGARQICRCSARAVLCVTRRSCLPQLHVPSLPPCLPPPPITTALTATSACSRRPTVISAAASPSPRGHSHTTPREASRSRSLTMVTRSTQREGTREIEQQTAARLTSVRCVCCGCVRRDHRQCHAARCQG